MERIASNIAGGVAGCGCPFISLICVLFLHKKAHKLEKAPQPYVDILLMECNMYMCMFTLFYVCINLSRCTIIPNCKQVSLYVIVRAHTFELASRACIQRK